jgi:hypothetical protein
LPCTCVLFAGLRSLFIALLIAVAVGAMWWFGSRPNLGSVTLAPVTSLNAEGQPLQRSQAIEEPVHQETQPSRPVEGPNGCKVSPKVARTPRSLAVTPVGSDFDALYLVWMLAPRSAAKGFAQARTVMTTSPRVALHTTTWMRT